MRDPPEPTLQDIFAARAHVYRYLTPTPLYRYAGLCDLVGTDIWVKHENHQPGGAFKVRGGLNYVAGLTGRERSAGLFTASTGNHGQSIAYAARAFDTKATIAVPEGSNPGKVAAMRGLGAEVVFHGQDFDTAREWISAEAHRVGGNYVEPTDASLICGVGTYALEILEDLPDVDVIIVPVGGGSGVSGTAIVAKAINPNIQVIGVGAEKAPAAYLSWKSGSYVEASMETFAEGLATRVPFELTQEIMRDLLDDFILVSEEEIKAAILLLLEKAHTLTEGAGAVSLAGALKIRARLAGKKVALVVSGGNLDIAQLREIVAA